MPNCNYAKFWLKPVCIARSRGFRDHELNDITEIVENNINIWKGNGMNTLAVDYELLVMDLKCTTDALIVVLEDGRKVSVPLA